MTRETRSIPAPPTGAQAAPLGRGRRWAALGVLTASLLVIVMDMTILNIALPDMAADLEPTAAQQLWIVDVYSLVLAGLLVSAAAIADRWGRKRMLLLGYAIFGAASLLVLPAASAEAVIAVRALLGVGGAMIMPMTLSLIRVIFVDPRERATALGVWAAVSGLGAAVGPLIGGVLLEHFSWHSAFLVNVPLMAAAIVAGALLLPESRVPATGRWDWFAALLSLVGMTALVWAIKTFGEEASLAVPAAWTALLVGGALLAWFAVRCLRSPAPLLDLRLFRERTFSAGIVAALGSTFAMVAALLLLAQWLQLVDGASPVEAGVRLLPIAVASAVASLVAAPLARVIGARTVLGGGLALAGIGMLLLGAQPGELLGITVTAALTLIGAGMGSLAIASALIMHGTPEEKAGNAGALEETSYEFGALLGVAVLGSIAAIMYRAEFEAGAALDALDRVTAAEAEESLGAAVAIAEAHGLPQLAVEAGEAFTRSLQVTGLVGGSIILAVAVAVFCMVPRGTDVQAAAH